MNHEVLLSNGKPSTQLGDPTDLFPTGMEINQILQLRSASWNKPWESDFEIMSMIKTEKKPLIEELGRSPLPTEYGNWTYIVFGDYTNGAHHEMLIFGNVAEDTLGGGEDILVRMHSSCRTSETFAAINCECKEELNEAMKMVQDEGKGIVIYLEQEGRGTGISGKMAQLNGMFEWKNGNIEQKRDSATGERIDTDRAYKNAGYPSEARDFSVAGEMLHHVGVKSVRLLTNNPRKVRGVESAGIKVQPIEIHIPPENEIIASDLRSKAVNLGHNISEKHLQIRGNEN